MKIKFIALLFLLSLIQACTQNNVTTGEHPDPSKLPPDESVENHLQFDAEVNSLEEYYTGVGLSFDTFNDNINNQGITFYYDPDIVRIGKPGNIYIINREMNSVDMYSSGGDFQQRIGRPGHGPGELVKVVTFDLSANSDTLYVLDAQKVEIFILEDGTYKPEYTFRTGYQLSYDMCVMGSEVFVSGYGFHSSDHQNLMNGEANPLDVEEFLGPIALFSPGSYDIQKTFGFSVSSFSGIGAVSGMLSETRLNCNRQTNTVIGQMRHFPYMFGYDNEGNKKWTSRIDGLRSTRVIEFEEKNGKPGVHFYANEESYHKYFRFSDTHDEYSIIHIINSPPNPQYEKPGGITEDRNTRNVVIVNSETGEMEMYKSSLTLEAIRNGLAVSSVIDLDNYEYSFYIHQ